MVAPEVTKSYGFFTTQLGRLVASVAPHSLFGLILFPPKPTYDPATDMPDLTGKVAIVTGGNTGIGFETVKQLLLKNSKVYLAARDETKAMDAIAKLKDETGHDAIFLKMDLADLDSVKAAANEFLGKEERLHLLYNNAYVLASICFPPSAIAHSSLRC